MSVASVRTPVIPKRLDAKAVEGLHVSESLANLQNIVKEAIDDKSIDYLSDIESGLVQVKVAWEGFHRGIQDTVKQMADAQCECLQVHHEERETLLQELSECREELKESRSIVISWGNNLESLASEVQDVRNSVALASRESVSTQTLDRELQRKVGASRESVATQTLDRERQRKVGATERIRPHLAAQMMETTLVLYLWYRFPLRDVDWQSRWSRLSQNRNVQLRVLLGLSLLFASLVRDDFQSEDFVYQALLREGKISFWFRDLLVNVLSILHFFLSPFDAATLLPIPNVLLPTYWFLTMS